jgi:hypothetical protein
LAHPRQDTTLARALEEMGKGDARFAVRTGLVPGKDWYREGGVGRYVVGRNDVPSRVEDFRKYMVREQLGDQVKAAMVAPDANDLPSGRRVETGYTQYTSTMDIRFTATNLQGIFVETIQAYRFIGGGGGLAGGISYLTEYPIELPNIALDHVSTTVRLPIGLATPEAGPAQPSGAGAGVSANEPWPRDPRVAFARYRDGLEAIAKANPKTQVVWSTMPITGADNLQRSFFNLQVRQYCTAKGRPLFDVAAIMSHGADGRLSFDDQGETLAKSWQEPGTRAELNQAGRQRVAEAWWTLMSKLSGWKPEPKADVAATP